MTNRISPLSLNITYWLINLLLIYTIYSVVIIFRKSILPFLELDLSDMNHVARNIFIAEYTISTVLALVIIFVTFVVFFIFRKLIRNVKRGNPFTTDNIKLLKKFSIGILVIGIVGITRTLTEQLFSTFQDAPIFYYKYSWYLIIAIIVWSLTHVFSIGLNLQKEKDLTI